MSQRRARLQRSLTLRLWLARVPAILVVAALLAGMGWVSMQYRPGSVDRCVRAYDQAHTAADSASADQVVVGALGRSTCGHLRREGTLDRHRDAAERQRTANRAEGHSVIEK
jgi:hypothetical protein